jgi:hypothetical protein
LPAPKLPASGPIRFLELMRRAHTSVDRNTEVTLAHAREALRLEDATLALIREEGAAVVASLSEPESA